DNELVIDDGSVVNGSKLKLATVDFLAKGGDEYPLDDINHDKPKFTYQEALENYIKDKKGLDGKITQADVEVAGRIVDTGGSFPTLSPTPAPTTSAPATP
ncbi:unnamed protein product, partial [Discosporangium mesarthrocarpum]